jgi:hypothetical protein
VTSFTGAATSASLSGVETRRELSQRLVQLLALAAATGSIAARIPLMVFAWNWWLPPGMARLLRVRPSPEPLLEAGGA